jgi:DNA primase
VEGRVALLPAGHDPDSYVRAEGPAAIAALVEGARPLAEFAFDTLVREHGLTLAGKNKIVGELKLLINESADPEQRALMGAHFSEKLGISQGYFLSGQKAVKIQSVPVDSSPPQGLAHLPKQEKQLVDFLILYPEYFGELKKTGLVDIIQEPAVVRFIGLLEQASGAASCQPEQLLEIASDEEERGYIVHLLTQGLPQEAGQESEHGQRMYDELVQWLHSVAHKRAAADLQQQINRAEGLGNTGLLMDLIRRKQEMEQKRRGF